MFAPDQLDLAKEILSACEARGLRLATAESCTGGLIAACLTAIAGSSAVLDRGFVVYGNRAKAEMLAVPADCLARFGAVSAQTARAMAEGALTAAGVDLAVAVTGIAGPTGGSADKPVGLVYFAAARRGRPPLLAREVFAGDRQAVRAASVTRALALLLQVLAAD